jgi:hypothetical protein
MAQTSTQTDFDSDIFIRNRNQWTLEQLAPYRDRWVAWSLDGKSIVAHHENPLEVVRLTKELGLIGGEYLMSFLPADDSEIWL